MQIIVTNNPLVREHVTATAAPASLIWVEGYTEDVLLAVRDLCHRNHRLLTHPLAGSVKPNQTPYKTVVLEPADAAATDGASVIMAEASLQKARDMLRDSPRPAVSFGCRGDFACIDFDLFKSFHGEYKDAGRTKPCKSTT